MIKISNVRRYSKYTAAPNISFFKFDGKFDLERGHRYDFVLIFGDPLPLNVLSQLSSPIAIKVNNSKEFDMVLEASRKYLQDTSRLFITGSLDPFEYVPRIQAFDGKPLSMKRTPVGIQNLGTTCFMNAFMQLMYTIYDTFFYFVEREYKGETLIGFFQLLKDMKEGRLSTCLFIPGYSGQEDDPHILIDYILNDPGQVLFSLTNASDISNRHC